MNMGMSAEATWAELCFGLGISDKQIDKLKPTFKWAWTERNTTMRSAMQSRDMATMQAKAAQMKDAIDKALKAVLTKSQLASYTKWVAAEEAARAARRAAMGGGMGKGGPGGGQHK